MIVIICKENNISFLTEEKEFNDRTSVIVWIINNQLGRRNLPDYARVELNLRKEAILKPIANKNKGLGRIQHNSAKFNVREKIAKVSQVSHDTVAKVKFIKEKADEQIKEKLRAGNKEDRNISKL